MAFYGYWEQRTVTEDASDLVGTIRNQWPLKKEPLRYVIWQVGNMRKQVSR
jgi:hypothetical protein